MTFRGILDKSLGGYLTFRGFAKLGDIEKLSIPDPAYQRDLITTHQEEIKNFLTSGKNLFFPEVILGCKIAENDELKQLDELFEAYNKSNSQKFDFKKMKIELQTRTEFQSGEDIRSKGYFRAVILKFLQKHIELAKTQKPFKRIDGNHRISAAILDEKIKNLNIPFCIVFFRNQEEEEKYSRVIFHNINYKSIPLSMEESLKLILENEILFSDEELKGNNFGWEYYFTRKIEKEDFNKYFPHLSNIFNDNFRTNFLKLFKLLTEKGFLEKSEESINKVRSALSNINEIYADDVLKNSQNGALFCAFMYFKLSEENLLNGFKKWVLKNHIYSLKEVEPKSLVDIYTKIAQSKIKNIFVAMAFSENNSNNVWDAISTVYDELIKQENLQLDKSKQENGKYIPNRVDKGLDVSKDIIYEIKNGISDADLVIVDLSYGKQNVYYEMGLAEAQQKPIIILHDESIEEDKIHFDVSTQSRIKYNSNNLPELRSKLKEVLKTIIEEE
jgi:hypothetical protein